MSNYSDLLEMTEKELCEVYFLDGEETTPEWVLEGIERGGMTIEEFNESSFLSKDQREEVESSYFEQVFDEYLGLFVYRHSM